MKTDPIGCMVHSYNQNQRDALFLKFILV